MWYDVFYTGHISCWPEAFLCLIRCGMNKNDPGRFMSRDASLYQAQAPGISLIPERFCVLVIPDRGSGDSSAA